MVLEYTWQALDDLERIKEMYSELSGPSSAMKHMETITRSIRLLTTSPPTVFLRHAGRKPNKSAVAQTVSVIYVGWRDASGGFCLFGNQ